MPKFTEEELQSAKLILNQRNVEAQEKEILDLGEQLEVELEQVLSKMGLSIVEDQWMDISTLGDVAFQSVKSLEDFRHRYPHSIHLIKYISIVAFWIIKLKPISGIGLKHNGEWQKHPTINERVVQRWIHMKITKAVEDDLISEFLPKSQKMANDVRVLFEGYYQTPLFNLKRDVEESKLRENNKSSETRYYMRYKKMTAINIYESLIHLLLPLRLGFSVQSESSEA